MAFRGPLHGLWTALITKNNTHSIHGTNGIFTYIENKIKHSCRQIYRSSHGCVMGYKHFRLHIFSIHVRGLNLRRFKAKPFPESTVASTESRFGFQWFGLDRPFGGRCFQAAMVFVGFVFNYFSLTIMYYLSVLSRGCQQKQWLDVSFVQSFT